MNDHLNWRWEHETQTSMNFTNLVVVFFYCQVTLTHKVTVDYITAHSNFMCWTDTFSVYHIQYNTREEPSEVIVNLWFLLCLRHLPALPKTNNTLKTTEQMLYPLLFQSCIFSILYINDKPFIVTFVYSSTYTQNYSIAFECDVHCSFLQ